MNNLKLNKMKKINLFKTMLFAFLAISTLSCSDDDETGVPQSNTIAAIAQRTDDLSILVQALVKADLVSVLDGTDDYTVFAPTNAAFTAFLTANNIPNLDAVPVATLREILLNHVVVGTVSGDQLPMAGYIKTLGKGSASSTNTLNMYVNKSNGVRLNGVSTVSTPNIAASNGLIHIVNAVIGLPTVVTFATADPTFSTLAGALTAQGLVPTLNGTSGSPFTVFAPNNAAFDALNDEIPGVVASLTSEQLTAVLTYHVVAGANVLAGSLTDGMEVTTFETGLLIVDLDGGASLIDEAGRNTSIIATDVQAANGVIHVLGNVLIPSFN